MATPFEGVAHQHCRNGEETKEHTFLSSGSVNLSRSPHVGKCPLSARRRRPESTQSTRCGSPPWTPQLGGERAYKVASGRTGVRAKAAILLRARNRLHRPKGAFKLTDAWALDARLSGTDLLNLPSLPALAPPRGADREPPHQPRWLPIAGLSGGKVQLLAEMEPAGSNW